MKESPQNHSRDDAYQRFTTLLVSNQPAILGFIRSLIPNSGESEDLLQKTCLIAWQKFDQFDPQTRFSTWACQIAYFEVKNYLRTRARDRHVFSDELLAALAEEAPRDTERLAEERRALGRCVAMLQQNERDLLGQCYARDAKVSHVAQQLNRTANSVYKELNRLRRRLLACISARLQEGGAL